MFANKLAEAHGLLFCCHAELVPAVVLANWRPELPAVTLLGTFEDATLMLFSPTPENARAETGSISVHFELVNAVVVTDAPFRVWPVKLYSVFTERPDDVQGVLFCCQPEFVAVGLPQTNAGGGDQQEGLELVHQEVEVRTDRRRLMFEPG